MIIALIVSILLRNNKIISWLVFAAGSIFTLVSLIGKQHSAALSGLTDVMTVRWILYFILLAGGALTIVFLQRKDVDHYG